MDEMELVRELGALRADAAVLQKEMRTAFRRIDEQQRLVEGVHALALTLREMAAELKAQRREMEHLREDVEQVRAHPAQRWETLVRALLTALAGALAGAGMGLLVR